MMCTRTLLSALLGAAAALGAEPVPRAPATDALPPPLARPAPPPVQRPSVPAVPSAPPVAEETIRLTVDGMT